MGVHGTELQTQVAGTIAEKLNNNSFYALLSAIVDELQSGANGNTADLEAQINALAQQLEAVSQEAKILTENELAQLEEALKETLENLEANGYLEGLCVEVGGETYSLKELVKRLASVDKIVATDIEWNSTYTEIVKITYTLEDTTKINFLPTLTDTENTKHYLFDGNYKGNTVSFEIEYAKVNRPLTVAGETVNTVEFVLTRTTNVVFDILTGLDSGACGLPPIAGITPDLNSDGHIGTPPPVGMYLSTEYVNTLINSTETIEIHQAVGDVTVTSSDEDIVIATLNGTTIELITGDNVGTATITVTDDEGEIIVTVDVNIDGDGIVIP